MVANVRTIWITLEISELGLFCQCFHSLKHFQHFMIAAGLFGYYCSHQEFYIR